MFSQYTFLLFQSVEVVSQLPCFLTVFFSNSLINLLAVCVDVRAAASAGLALSRGAPQMHRH